MTRGWYYTYNCWEWGDSWVLIIGYWLGHWWLVDYNAPKIGWFSVNLFSTKQQKVSNKKGQKDKVILKPFMVMRDTYRPLLPRRRNSCHEHTAYIFESLDCRMSYSSVMRGPTKLSFRLNTSIFIAEIVQEAIRSHGPLHIRESFLMTEFCLIKYD